MPEEVAPEVSMLELSTNTMPSNETALIASEWSPPVTTVWLPMKTPPWSLWA